MSTIAQPQRRLEVGVAAASLAGGIALIASGIGYGLFHSPGVGAGFMPTVAGVIIAGTATSWLLRMLRMLRGSRSGTAPAVAPTTAAVDGHGAHDANPMTDSAIGILIADGIDEEDDDIPMPDARGWLRVAIIVGAMVVGALVLPMLGYTLTVALLLFVVLKFVSERRWWLAAIIAIGAALLSRLVFQVWLGTYLPSSSILWLHMIGI